MVSGNSMRRRIRALSAGFALSWRADRRLTILLSATVLAASATGPVLAVGVRGLIDGVLQGNEAAAMWWAVAVAAALGMGMFLYTASISLTSTLSDRTSLEITRWLMRSSSTLPGLEHHERPEYLDRMQLLQNDTATLVNALPSAVQTVGLVVEIATTLVLLAALHPVLAVLPLFALPSLGAGVLAQRRQNDTARANAEPQRLLAHLFSLALDARSSKELRIFGASDHVVGRWRSMWDSIERRRLAALVYSNAVSTAGTLVFVAGQAGAVIVVILAVRDGTASVGDVGLVISLAARISGQMSRAVASSTSLHALGQAMDRYLWLQDYERASRAELGDTQPPDRLDRGIDFRNVEFRYPGADTPVLRDVNLHIPAGSTVAIVGENGAGKTTLVKLLCGFYNATAGTVVIDDIDLRAIDIRAWRRRISAAFQDVLRLKTRAGESVAVGDQTTEDPGAVDKAISRAGAADVVAAMPHGLDTQLGRDWNDGVDLSGGQWQKLGLARAMMRQTPLLLLMDEPTSALDPHSEHLLFDKCAAAARHAQKASGAITVLVSHRFSTVQMADLIIVIASGTIIEAGTHAHLLAADGLYAELFDIQAAAYS